MEVSEVIMKKYLDCFVPIYVCNLKCHYCYISLLDNFGEGKQKFPRSTAEMVEALSAKRWGDGVYINLCAGGETLLLEDSVELVRGLLTEGHHVSVVTNGLLTARFDELVKLPADLLKRLFFKFSYHYLELKRLNKFDTFFANVRKVRDAGCSFTVEVTPSDELVPYVEDCKQRCMNELGGIPHCTIARDDRKAGIDIWSDMSFEDYCKQWSTFDSELFRYKTYLYHNKVKSFCYAGDWSYYINLATGDVAPCNCGGVFANLYEDINQPLPKRAMGNGCTLPYCYNGHGWISLGVNPTMEHPIYTDLRNRICPDGTEWITPEFKEFWGEQMFVTNPAYTAEEMRKVNRRRKLEKLNPKNMLRKIVRKIRD